MSLLKLLIPIFSLTLIGCSQSADADWGDPQENSEVIEIEEDVSPEWFTENFQSFKDRWQDLQFQSAICAFEESLGQNAFHCVQQACENAGGHFNSLNQTCQCPASTSELLIFTAVRGGHCLPPRPSDDQEKANLLYIISEGQLQNSEEFLKNKKDINSAQASPFKKLLLENHFHIELADEKTSVEALLANLGPDRTPGGNGTIRPEFSRKTVFWQGEVGPYISKSAFEAESLWALKPPIDNILSLNEEGCAGQCYVERWKETSEGYLLLRELFLEGQRMSAKVYFTPRKNRHAFTKMVHLDDRGQANLIYKKKQRKFESGAFEYRVDISTRSGDDLYKDVLISPEKEILESLMTRVDYPSNTPADERMVSVCEWGVNPYSFRNDWERVVFGPYTSTDQSFRGSVWGWYPNEHEDAFMHTMAAYPHYDLGYADRMVSIETQLHHHQVMKTVLKASTQATVTAQHYKACYNKDPQINPLASPDYPGRVVNISAFNQFSGKTCNEMVEFVESTQSRLLWVIASGNDYREKCEDRIMKLSNVVGVTGVEPNNPTRIRSDYVKGRDKVALAVIRFPKPGAGTSFAAPIVAAWAADIFHKYPWMSVAQVRRALTLGVDFHKWDVMSGGLTTQNKVMRVAGMIDQEPEITDVDILKELYRLSEASLHRLRQQHRELQIEIDDINRDLEELAERWNQFKKCQEEDAGPLERFWDWWGKEDPCEDDLWQEKWEQVKVDYNRTIEERKNLKSAQETINNNIRDFYKFDEHKKWITKE